eukprot:747617-Hanusia_phi.AAC.2
MSAGGGGDEQEREERVACSATPSLHHRLGGEGASKLADAGRLTQACSQIPSAAFFALSLVFVYLCTRMLFREYLW